MRSVSEAFPHKEQPPYALGALQGEALYGSYNAQRDDNYLYTLNAQSCVITTLFDPHMKRGALIHFDHNIESHIDDALCRALNEMGVLGRESEVVARLVGGIWLQGEDIGGVIRNSLASKGVEAAWDHYSFSTCWEHTYGAVLDLESGTTTVFEHSPGTVQNFLTPLLSQAAQGRPSHPEGVEARARDFMERFRSIPVMQRSDGSLTYTTGAPATERDIAAQTIRFLNPFK